MLALLVFHKKLNCIKLTCSEVLTKAFTGKPDETSASREASRWRAGNEKDQNGIVVNEGSYQ